MAVCKSQRVQTVWNGILDLSHHKPLKALHCNEIGTTICFFFLKAIGIDELCSEVLNMFVKTVDNCSLHAFRTQPEILSRPAALLVLIVLKVLFKSTTEM